MRSKAPLKGYFEEWQTINFSPGNTSLPGPLVQDLMEIISNLRDKIDFERFLDYRTNLMDHILDEDDPHDLTKDNLESSVIECLYKKFQEYGYAGTIEDMLTYIFTFHPIASVKDMDEKTSKEKVTPAFVYDYAFRIKHNEASSDTHSVLVNALFPGRETNITPTMGLKPDLFLDENFKLNRKSEQLFLNQVFLPDISPVDKISIDHFVFNRGGIALFDKTENKVSNVNNYSKPTFNLSGLTINGPCKFTETTDNTIHSISFGCDLFPQRVNTLSFTMSEHNLMKFCFMRKNKTSGLFEPKVVFDSNSIGAISDINYSVDILSTGGKSTYVISFMNTTDLRDEFVIATLSDSDELEFSIPIHRSFILENLQLQNREHFSPPILDEKVREYSEARFLLEEWNEGFGSFTLKRSCPFSILDSFSLFSLYETSSPTKTLEAIISKNNLVVLYKGKEVARKSVSLKNGLKSFSVCYNEKNFILLTSDGEVLEFSIDSEFLEPTLHLKKNFNGYLFNFDYYPRPISLEQMNFILL